MPPVSESASAPSQPVSVPAPALPTAEDVRALARLLQDAELSEIAWEDTSGEHAHRVVLRRTLLAASTVMVSPLGYEAGSLDTTLTPSIEDESGDRLDGASPVTPPPTLPTLVVASPVVGIFQTANPPLEAGTAIKVGQILGYVESMRVPNEVRTPSTGTLSAVLCLPGQGVEYGQLLFEIAVEPQEVTP